MSFETTEVSPNNNNNKENSEIFDDPMVCDDDTFIDNNGMRKGENNESITVEVLPAAVTDEIPSKYDTCTEVRSTFGSPKSKKRKLLRSDEWLENLQLNFTKLLLFLESDNKELAFPFVVKEYEEFFEMIVQDINILQSKSSYADYRDICDKIIVAATGYVLTCVYEYRQDFQKIVMVIKKEHKNMMDQSENGTSSFFCATESIMPSSQISSEVDSTEVLSRSPTPGPISSGFKLQCLRTTLAFIKNDITNTEEFPELNFEQAHFMQLLLESVIAFTEFDSNLEMKDLYRALWEAVRIYRLKYEFRVKCEESSDGKKNLLFEKVPKNKPPVTAVNSNQTMNPKTDVSKTEAPKTEAPKTEAPNTGAPNTEAPNTGAPNTEAPNTGAPNTEAPNTEVPNTEVPNTEVPNTEVPNTEVPNTEVPNTEVPNTEVPNTEVPNTEVPNTEAPNTEVPNTEVPNTADPIPEASKPLVSRPDASEPQTLKAVDSKSKPWFPMPVIPKLPYFNQIPTRITKRMLNRKLKMENENLFIKRLPSKFISDTLNTIRDFLLDEDRHKLVLVPKSHTELDFYRNCLSWCRTTFVVSKFGKEFQEMHYQISCLLFRVNCTVNKSSSSKINETTGIKEVIYIKERKHVPVGPVVEPAQSAPKKKKINIQNAIQLAETDNMKLETVIDLNKSLRNKKKNKKREKSKLKAASKEATAKSLNQAKSWTDGSSSNCSSRGTSRDRYKKVAQAQNVAKRPMNEINQSAKKIFQETLLSRRGEETIRKEQLKEALSVPVQSDKAMKMMRGMGWSGGALGARGNGITEPLKPTLDLARGAGFGHSRNGQSKTFAKKPRESKKAPAFVSQNSSASSETDNMETDVIVQKTNQLLLENPTLDKILKAIESNVELPKSTKTTVELPKPIKANVEPPKPTTSIPKQQLQSLITPTESSNELLKPGNSNLEYRLSFREEILYTILELLTSDATSKTLTYKNKICKKKRRFVGNVRTIKTRNNFGIFQKEEHDIYREILDKYKKCPEVIFETLYSYDFKTVQITKKVLTEVQTPQQQLPSFSQLALKANSEKKTEENIHSYITSSGTNYETEGADEVLKFKVLFLSNILSFVKSFNEEIEVTFDKVLNRKQQTYIQNVVDEVNMRIKFGSSPAETKLCAEIGNHVKDAFLAYMFDHQYKVVTLSKYFRRKRFKRPDDAVKGTCQTTVNLDAVSSDTFSASKLNTNEPPVKENNNNCTVLKLTPDEEGINISNFLHLYDKEKTNTAGIENHSNVNKDSASKKNLNVTEHSNKNNIGNGNIVIDNDDSQVIDMKRDCDNTKNNEKENNIVDTEMVKYVVCVDCSEEAVDSREMTVDINKEKEEILTDIKKDGEEIDQTMKHSDIVVANDVVEMVNQHKDIGIDKINKMIGEVLSNTEDTIDQNEIVIEDSDSNDCTETIVNDEIQNCDNSSTNNKDINEDTDVIMKEIDDEPMEGISITENSKEVIDKEDSVKEINIEESMGLINQVKYMEEINKIESSKGKEISKMEKENSINPSDEQIVKGDLEIKIDCDIISKEKLVLSEGLCDTHSVGLSHVKTVGTETDIHISKDTDIKTVRIVHANHPIEELTNENIKEIQRHISNRIFLATQLPLLKCHGVQNGALIYSCHNKNTYDWLQNAISVASYVKVLNTKEITKMALKLYCFFDFDTKDLFRMIESYNQELSTKDWVVENTEKDGDCITFILRMDKFSIKFIQESDLALFAGIDKIQFSPVWE